MKNEVKLSDEEIFRNNQVLTVGKLGALDKALRNGNFLTKRGSFEFSNGTSESIEFLPAKNDNANKFSIITETAKTFLEASRPSETIIVLKEALDGRDVEITLRETRGIVSANYDLSKDLKKMVYIISQQVHKNKMKL